MRLHTSLLQYILILWQRLQNVSDRCQKENSSVVAKLFNRSALKEGILAQKFKYHIA